MPKKLQWRLSKLPTPDEVRELVKDKIITQEEAREILFSQETEEDRDKKSLETEIKFLRELVSKLSSTRTQIVETIREVYVPYKRWDWYKPYEVWCSSASANDNVTYAYTSTPDNSGINTLAVSFNDSFSNIKTF